MKYLRATALGFLLWCLTFALVGAVSFVTKSLIYPAFLEWFPDFIPEYNFVNERENYEKLHLILNVITVSVSIFMISYISIRLDNERMEYMITKTEGKYTLSEGLEIYFPRYLTVDAVAAAAIPLPLIAVYIFVLPLAASLPEGVVSLINIPLEPTRVMISAFGAFGAYIFMAALFFVSRLLSGIRAIDVWRVLWLSDIQFVG